MRKGERGKGKGFGLEKEDICLSLVMKLLVRFIDVRVIFSLVLRVCVIANVFEFCYIKENFYIRDGKGGRGEFFSFFEEEWFEEWKKNIFLFC